MARAAATAAAEGQAGQPGEAPASWKADSRAGGPPPLQESSGWGGRGFGRSRRGARPRFRRRALPRRAGEKGALGRAGRPAPAHGARPAAPGGGGRRARLRGPSGVQALADSALSRPERKAAVTVTR